VSYTPNIGRFANLQEVPRNKCHRFVSRPANTKCALIAYKIQGGINVSQNTKAAPTLRRTGTIVIETFALDLSGVREGKPDPEKTVREAAANEGIAVNRVHVLKQAEFAQLRQILGLPNDGGQASLRNQYFHMVYPPGEASGWICCCVD
jgi:hypothetical protein